MSETSDLACWLCERPLETRIQWHHPIPKSKKGRVTVPIHPICHKAIHANFTNAELARMGADLGVIRAHPEIAKFIRWISSKPPDFHAPTRK
ncbi:HNH endonuclease [Altererythrobacter sp.]|uniref:HNH endonuclease n=1 Tax=Altererythrobacter sp. TaxID=1872480 RepID=UPI001B273F1D|nr:HNH endonuclease [Altererythrobacter sp.]MBO6608635.1 HNH endonuclease [Altererythrobacter sp.]MBO6642889.1 HNH endonuclease [Altererythrobacter sp.]MBO6709632.1 HNH endonuclease [Altererythrobacter sp.]